MTLNFKFLLVSLAEILLKLTGWERIIFHLSLVSFLSPSQPQLQKVFYQIFHQICLFLLHLLDFCSFLEDA